MTLSKVLPDHAFEPYCFATCEACEVAASAIVVADRKFERIELERFPQEYGLPPEVLVGAFAEADVKRPTGPAPSPQSRDDRVAKALKKAGYGKATGRVVARYRALLQRYRPDLFPPAPPRGPARPPTEQSVPVVPFRKPTGNDKPDGNGPTAA